MMNNFMMMGGGRGPTFVGAAIASTASGTANNKSVTLSPHIDTEVGDLLIMSVSRSGSSNANPFTMTGWTRITPANFPGSIATLSLFYRYRQAGETSYTTDAISSSYTVVAVILTFRGAAVGGSEVSNTVVSNTVTIPGLPSISTRATLVSFFVLGTSTSSAPGVTSTPPGSEVVINQPFAQARSHRLWIGMEPNQPSGPTGDRVLGFSLATQARAVLLEIR